MLVNLYIENYVLFDKQNLNFNDGFIAITGDTGAGKSLIIDALGYLCGNRLLTTIAKDTNKNTFIEGTFTFNNKKTLNTLSDLGIPFDETYIISREITVDNRSIARINGRSVTLSTLKDVFEFELDIHSQRDTQYLLNKSVHLNLVDAYGKHEEILNDVKNLYKTYSKIKKEIYDLENTFYNEIEIEFIKEQLKQIDIVKPDEKEYNELSDEVKMMTSFEKIYDNLKIPLDILNSNNGVIENLYEFKNKINHLSDFEGYESLIERSNSLYLEVVDIKDELASQLDGMHFDQFALNRIEERLFEMSQLLRRYGGSFEIFNDKYQEMKQKIDYFESKDIVLFELNKKLKLSESAYLEKAKLLSEKREIAKDKLVNSVLEHLKDLELDNAQFEIKLERKDYSNNGIDDIEFLVSMNRGFALEPLNKVASGGELSRLMLGLKVVFSKLFGISTVIFDEIDTGVSGSVASSIGFKMAELAKSSQTFAVTHLAQVAACSNYNFYVTKDNSDKVGKTTIKILEGSELIEKLAIMSTGINSESSIKTARELYEMSQSKVNS